MPGMPIFQDSPSQLKGQIYVVDKDDSNKVVPLSVDSTGSLSTSLASGTTVGLASGTTVGLASGTTVGLTSGATVGLASGTTVGLTSGATVGLTSGTVVGLEAGTDIDTVTTVGTVTNDVKIVNGATALTTALASGTTVGLSSGTVVGLEAGTDIDTVSTVTTVGTVTNDVKIVNGATALTTALASGTTVGLTSGTTVGLANGSEVGLASGATVGLATGANVIGKVQNDLVFTNVDSFGGATPLVSKTITASTTVNANSQNISKESSYNWFISNTGTLATQDITLKVQLSPDGGTNWIDDTGIDISVPHGTSKMITVNNFLQNARFVVTGGSADTTVISCFQAQH